MQFQAGVAVIFDIIICSRERGEKSTTILNFYSIVLHLIITSLEKLKPHQPR